MSDKLQKLDDILKILNRDVPSTKEVADLVLRIVSAVKQAKKHLEDQAEEHKDALEESLSQTAQEIFERIESFEQETSADVSGVRKETDERIAKLVRDIDKSLQEIATLIPEAVDLTGIEARLTTLEDEPPVTDEEIRNKLEGLEGDQRLDKSAIKGLDEEITRLDERISSRPAGVGGKQLMAVPFSFSGDGATTQFYLPTEPAGKGWFLFAHYQGQWLQKDVHYSINKKVFDTAGGSSSFTPEDGTTIEGFLIF